MNRLPLLARGWVSRESLALKTRVPDAIEFFEVAPENWIDLGGAYGRRFRLCRTLSLCLPRLVALAGRAHFAR